MLIGTSGDPCLFFKTIPINNDYFYISLGKFNIYHAVNTLGNILFGRKTVPLFLPLPFVLLQQPDLFHLFNQVAITRNKWIATFDHRYPFNDDEQTDHPHGLYAVLPRLLRENCIGLIALSEAAFASQLTALAAFPEAAAQLRKKMIVLPPPQPLGCSTKAQRHSRTLRLVFVGDAFFTLGGAEVILAIGQLLDDGYFWEEQLHVTLVGNLARRHNIAHRHYQDDEAFHRHIHARLNRHRCFHHFETMTPGELLHLYRLSDVGLLPAWQVNYGFSILEMQANGCPVISSNVRALPEINPTSAGWVIGSILNSEREYRVNSATEKEQIRQRFITQIKSIVLELFEYPNQLREKGEGAIARIREYHDPERINAQLQEIYQCGVGERQTHSQHVAL